MKLPRRVTKRLGWLICLLLMACAVPPTASPTASVAPSRTPESSVATRLPQAPESLYHPAADAVARAKPGELIDAVELLAPAGMRAWTVLYGSIGLDGAPIAVSGMVLAPADPPTAGGYPVVAWAHGTTGIADFCAPSRAGGGALGELQILTQGGYVVTATDYEGLGTDGTHPYLIGVSEGRSVLDSIRAVQNLAAAHASDEAVVVGLSQGGHAALWAGQLAPTYAPELHLSGAMAGSPPTDMAAWASWTVDAAASGEIYTTYAPILLYGVWSEAYRLPMPFLTDTAQTIAAASRDGCDPSGLTVDPYVTDPASDPDWRARLVENSPGAALTTVPFLVLSPDDDQLVLYASQTSGVNAMCAIGDSVELRTVHGGHGASFAPEALQVIQGWIAARLAGAAPISTCPSA